jgi:ferredoxin--NADP+ reductase
MRGRAGRERFRHVQQGPNATIVYREDLNEDLCILRVRPDGGEIPAFEPGQFATLGVTRGAATGAKAAGSDERVRRIHRPYSIASSATEREWIELLVKRVAGGRLTEVLWELGAGKRLWLDDEIRGTFTLRPVPSTADIVLIATGTGLAPYASMVRTYRGRSRWRSLVLIHGVRYERDLAYREELERAARDDGTLAYVPVLSREPESSPWRGLRGRVQQALGHPALLNAPLDPERAHVLLCGNPEMIRSVSAMLVERGFRVPKAGRSGNLYYERYW